MPAKHRLETETGKQVNSKYLYVPEVAGAERCREEEGTVGEKEAGTKTPAED